MRIKMYERRTRVLGRRLVGRRGDMEGGGESVLQVMGNGGTFTHETGVIV